MEKQQFTMIPEFNQWIQNDRILKFEYGIEGYGNLTGNNVAILRQTKEEIDFIVKSRMSNDFLIVFYSYYEAAQREQVDKTFISEDTFEKMIKLRM